MTLSLLSAILWDVSPEVFTIRLFGLELPVPWYGLMFAVSILLGQQILTYIFKKDGKPARDVEVLIVYGVVGMLVGARLGHYLFYEWDYLLRAPLDWFISLVTPPFRGLASHGATITILVAIYLYSRTKADQTFLWVVDRVVIVVSLGGAFVRFGNLMNSEIYGKPTDLPWGFIFLRETDPNLLPLVPRHPTQIYESLFCIVLLAITFWLWKQKRHVLADGFITGVFIVMLFTFRFLVEFLKTEQVDFERGMLLNMGQILSIPAVLAGLIILWMANQTQKRKNESLVNQ
jgi:phosphatidylglycerol---prolipoprotein diacylglyceryl transferase